jgi:hypothetical protein
MRQAVNYNTINIAVNNGATYITEAQMFIPENLDFEQFVEDLVRKCADLCYNPDDYHRILNHFGYR